MHDVRASAEKDGRCLPEVHALLLVRGFSFLGGTYDELWEPLHGSSRAEDRLPLNVPAYQMGIYANVGMLPLEQEEYRFTSREEMVVFFGDGSA